MKQKIYIETSVVSYFVSNTSENILIAARQLATKKMWDIMKTFDVFISDIVVQEASQGDKLQANLRIEIIKDFKALKIDDEAKKLAKALLNGKSIPKKFPEDALHIAVAAVNGMDIIVTWNFKHINNPFTRMMIRQISENEGYTCPEICSPDEFLGDKL